MQKMSFFNLGLLLLPQICEGLLEILTITPAGEESSFVSLGTTNRQKTRSFFGRLRTEPASSGLIQRDDNSAFVQVSRPGSIGADDEEGIFKGGGKWHAPHWLKHAGFGALAACAVAFLLWVVTRVIKEILRVGQCCGWLRRKLGIDAFRTFPLQMVIHRLRDTRQAPNEHKQYQIRVSHAGDIQYKTQVTPKSNWDEHCQMIVLFS